MLVDTYPLKCGKMPGRTGITEQHIVRCRSDLSFLLLRRQMLLPEFDNKGDLPNGVHPATLDAVVERFGYGTPQREDVTSRLVHIYDIAHRTGKLERFVLFGSYVTSKPAPGDIDIILIMRDDFREPDHTEELLPVLDHQRAQSELGASVFWIRSSSILLESVDQFVAHWQTKRDLTRRGIVEIV